MGMIAIAIAIAVWQMSTKEETHCKKCGEWLEGHADVCTEFGEMSQ